MPPIIHSHTEQETDELINLPAVVQANMSKEDVDWLVMHQANQRILDAAATRLGLPAERVSLRLENSAAVIPQYQEQGIGPNAQRLLLAAECSHCHLVANRGCKLLLSLLTVCNLVSHRRLRRTCSSSLMHGVGSLGLPVPLLSGWHNR